jgi:hypothetical protein
MKSHLHVVVLVIVAGSLGAQPVSPDRERAVAEVLKAGGKVQRDEKRAGRPIVAVDLTACEVTAAGLKFLPSLTELETLDL